MIEQQSGIQSLMEGAIHAVALSPPIVHELGKAFKSKKAIHSPRGKTGGVDVVVIYIPHKTLTPSAMVGFLLCLTSFQQPGQLRLKLQSANGIRVLLASNTGFDDFI